MLANEVTASLARLSTYGPSTGCSLRGEEQLRGKVRGGGREGGEEPITRAGSEVTRQLILLWLLV